MSGQNMSGKKPVFVAGFLAAGGDPAKVEAAFSRYWRIRQEQKRQFKEQARGEVRTA